MNSEKMRNIMKEYQDKRDLHAAQLEDRLERIYSKYPQLAQLNRQIQALGIEMTKSILTDPSGQTIRDLEVKQEDLIKQKQDLMDANGIGPDYMAMEYDCQVCKDTGFLEDGGQCKCLKQKILNDSYEMSNLKQILSEDNFDNFDFSIFSDQPEEGYDLSPRENIKNIFHSVQEYISNFDKQATNKADNNLLFRGPTGQGKTFLCSCIAKQIMDRGYTVIYQTAFNLMDIIERYKFKTEYYTDSDEENYRNLFNCDLLIIDDLGTELINSFTSAELFNILNSRLNSRKKVIISTNLDIAHIGNLYTDRTLSRIVGNFHIYDFYGSDLRFR